MYIKTFLNKLDQVFTRVLVLLLALTILLPAELFYNMDFTSDESENISYGATVGGSGSTGSGGHPSADGGIKYHAGFKVSCMTVGGWQKEKLLNKDHPYDQWIADNSDSYINSTCGQFILNMPDAGQWSYGYYSPASGEMCWKSQNIDKYTFLGNPGSGRKQGNGHIFYDDIKNALTNDPDGFAAGGWKTMLQASVGQKGKCLANWGYLLDYTRTGYHVKTRFEECFNQSNTKWENYDEWSQIPEKVIEHKAEYLDMLFQFYAISDADQKNAISIGVETIANNEFVDKPFFLAIETAAVIVGLPNAHYVACTTNDYIQFNFGIDSTHDIQKNHDKYKGTALVGTYLGQLKDAVNGSLKSSPKRTRVSTMTYKAAKGTILFPFMHGAWGIFKGWAHTQYGYFHLQPDKTTVRIHEPLWFTAGANGETAAANGDSWSAYYGFNISYYLPAESKKAHIGKLEATPDEQMLNIKESGDPLGQDVHLILYPGVTTEAEKGIWDNIFKEAQADIEAGGLFDGFHLTAPLTRTTTCADYAGYTPQYTVDWSAEKVYDLDTFKSLVESNMPLLENDDLTSGYPVTLGTTDYSIKFEYFADVSVKCTIGGKDQEFKYKTKADVTDPASFLIPMYSPDRIRYISTPEAYAELKNYGAGSNQSGNLSEDWEVMAGVPTTEQLYYAAGGSEFIVDVSFEYSPDNTAVRSYTSYIEGVKCEHHGAGKDGMTPQSTGSYSQSGSVSGDIGGSWSVSSGDITISDGCDVCGNGGEWQVTINASYSNECFYHTCAGGENSQIITNGSGAYSEMCAAIAEIEASMNQDAENFQWTASSDGVTRYGMSFSWTAIPAQSTPDGNDGVAGCGGEHNKCGTHCGGHTVSDGSKSHTEYDGCGNACWGSPCNSGSQGSGSFTLVGTWTPHHICGPCCDHHLPDIYDTWSQSWQYDTFNITDAHVWRIDQAAASGLEDVIGPGVDNNVTYTIGNVPGTDGPYENPNSLEDGVVGACIKTNPPNIYYNIAMKNSNDLKGNSSKVTYLTQDGIGKATESSLVGRVRYNINGSWLDAKQHDEVLYKSGVSQATLMAKRTNVCDGMAKTHSGNDSPAGGGGHSEAWGKGFYYGNYHGAATLYGCASSSSVNASNVRSNRGAGAANTDANNYWFATGANDGNSRHVGQTTYPLNTKDFLINNTDDIDKATPEYTDLLAKRQQNIQPTIITDYLILQTTSGDQSLLYFDRQGETVTLEEEIPNIEIPQADMWENNSESCYDWEEDEINVGGYNGKYATPTRKFDGTGNKHKTKTMFDTKDPAETIVRPTRPARKLMLYSLPLNIITEIENKSYLTTEDVQSEVFWTNNLHWTDVTARSLGTSVNPLPPNYSTSETEGDTGFDFSIYEDLITTWAQDNNNVPHSYQGYILDTKYSPKHDIELNAMIIQDPISSAAASLISLPNERDQRYISQIGADEMNNYFNELAVCPGEASECEFAVLNCKYGQSELLAAYYFNDNTGLNSVNKNTFNPSTGWTISGNVLNGGATSSRIQLPMTGEFGITYQPGIRLNVASTVKLSSLPAYTDSTTGTLKTRVSQMLYSFDKLSFYVSTEGHPGFVTKDGQYREATNITLTPGVNYNISATFSFGSIDGCDLSVNGTTATFTKSYVNNIRFTSNDIGQYFYIGCMPGTSYGFRGTMDNIEINRLGGSYNHTDECYVMTMVHPNGMNSHVHTKECITTKEDNSTFETMTYNGVKYVKIFDHNTLTGGLFANSTEAQFCTSKGKLSLLSMIDELKASGKYQFLLYYPETGQMNIWKQSVNPLNDVIANGTGNEKATGYEAISISSTANYWGGLTRSTNAGATLLDGSVGHGNWYYALGCTNYWPNGSNTIPGMDSNTGVHRAMLYLACKSTLPGNEINSALPTAQTMNFSYTGGVQSIPLGAGTYKLEVWGAQGGLAYDNGLQSSWVGGKGGYSVGTLTLNNPTTVHVYVGGKGGEATGTYQLVPGGFNGGGNAYTDSYEGGGGGGGASDIRISSDSLYSRVIVAGGGGSRGEDGEIGGDGGGTVSVNGYSSSYNAGQTYAGTRGSFGQGASYANTGESGGSGGGGWYGGGGGEGSGSGGGSGYVYTASTASNYPSGCLLNSSYYLTSANTYAGNTSFAAPAGGSETGHSGNGYARITNLSGSTILTEDHKTVVDRDVSGYEYYKKLYENGQLTAEQLRQIFGDAYEDLFITSTSAAEYNSFNNSTLANFHTRYNCDLKTYSGKMIQSITGSSPSFILNQTITASQVSTITMRIDNKTTATKAKIYWSNNGTFTEAKSMTTYMDPEKDNQVIHFYVNNSPNWTGTLTQFKICIPAESDKNYGNSINYSSISFELAPPSDTDFAYTGNVQSYTVPVSGYYQIEAWGASGGNSVANSTSTASTGGNGGYSRGIVKLDAGQKLYFYVGGQGKLASTAGTGGGYNGGGNAGLNAYGGGGMTHVSTSGTDSIRTTSTVTSTTQTLYPAGKTWSYSYTGGMQSVSLQPGTYKLEAYGAQGGGSGGYGGYSTGTITLTSATTLYIGVGGQNATFNGGGSGYDYTGGGATHIATASGELSTLSGNKGSILLVAGGGGGGKTRATSSGLGGGANSNGTSGHSGCGTEGGGGTLSSGGSAGRNCGTVGSFGQGGTNSCSRGKHRNTECGGGGGYYGGGGGGHDCGGYNDNDDSGGGGGSGYANTSKLTSISGTTGTNSGNGKVVITAQTTITHTVNTVTNVDSITFNTNAALIVAGGGGGADNAVGTANGNDDGSGGAGGGAQGQTAYIDGTLSGAYGGTQTSGYKQGLGQSAGVVGDIAGAGGGWYGGLVTNHYNGGAGGGSGYLKSGTLLSTFKSTTGTTYTSTTIDGAQSIPNYRGGTMTGNNGNGYARIKYIETAPGNFPTLDEIFEVLDKLPNGSGIFSCTGELNTHICDNLCREVKTLNCVEPHHSGNHYSSDDLCYDACNDDAKHKPNNPNLTSDGTFTPGNFINIDWPFRIYFANIGDFYQSNAHGIGQLTNTRGMGYVNDMDVVTWTRVKQARFDCNVIYQDKLYLAGEWITLADKGDYMGEDGSPYNELNWSNFGTEMYDCLWGNLLDGGRSYKYQFYCVEANHEAAGSRVSVESFGINNPEWMPDSGRESSFPNYITNRTRAGKRFQSKHSCYNEFYIDIVGRIGNLAIIDTGDYRFSNLFKTPQAGVPTIPDPDVYKADDGGIVPTGSAVLSGTSIFADTAGSGALLTNVNLPKGTYRIYVNGSGLLNSEISLKTRINWEDLPGLDNSGAMVTTVQDVEVGTDPNTGDPVIGTLTTVEGPGIELEPGQYVITLHGTALNNPNWTITDGTSNIISYVTDKTILGDTIIIEMSVPSKIYDLQINGVHKDTKDIGIMVDFITVKKLDSSKSKELATTSALSNVAVTDSVRTYNLVVDNDTIVDISSVSNGLPISISSIDIQQLADQENNWLVEGIVKEVNEGIQNTYLTWKNDIRGLPLSEQTQYIDTYSTLEWAQTATCRMNLPLDASQNNIAILRDDPMLVGYDTYFSIGTIGDYYANGGGFLQVIPEYYAVNVKTGEFTPVDAYVYYDSSYYPVNIWGLVTGEDKLTWGPAGSGYDMSSIYNFVIQLDWPNEVIRRMVTSQEKYQTSELRDLVPGSPDGSSPLWIPSTSKYIMGNAQFLQLTGRARTFVGGETTYGELLNYSNDGRGSSQVYRDTKTGILYNPSGRIPASYWWMMAQRWHLTLGLPSSTVFVEASHEPDVHEIAKYKNAEYVILATVDIRALGQVWNLQYISTNDPITIINKDGTTSKIDIPEEILINGVRHKIPTAITVYQTVETPPDDIDIEANH